MDEAKNMAVQEIVWTEALQSLIFFIIVVDKRLNLYL